jgi:1-acyl-sn-glycerol-3-phosphate acyltransferase
MKKKEILTIVLVMWTIALPSKIIFLILHWSGKIKIYGAENLPKERFKMVVASNHDDVWHFMAELFAAPVLMLSFRQIIFHPIKSAFWFTPDDNNFKWPWLKPRAIPVRRNGGNGKVREPRKMLEVLQKCNGVIITQPECGRTRNGKVFLHSRSGKRKIRKLANYVGWLQVPVLPIWLEDGEEKAPTKKLFDWPCLRRTMAIVVGPLMEPKGSPEEFTKAIVEKLLELADQVPKEQSA